MAKLPDINFTNLIKSYSVSTVPEVLAAASPTQPTQSGTGTGINIQDIGYDIFPLMGQSNMAGHSDGGRDANYDFSSDRIFQYPISGTYEGKIIQATEPLKFDDGRGVNDVGPGMSFARSYLRTIPANRSVLLIPLAYGGTGFTNNRWRVGDDLYVRSVNAINATKLLPNSRVVAFLWHQGEQDVALSKSAYSVLLDAMITGMRSETGLQNTPFIVGQMTQNWVAEDATRQVIQAAITETPLRLPRCLVASSVGCENNGTVIHFSALGYRQLGEKYFNVLHGLLLAETTVPTSPTNLQASSTTNSSITLQWTSSYNNFDLDYKQATNPSYTTVSVTGSTHTLTGLQQGTQYNFRIRAKNNLGNSPYSSVLTASTTVPASLPSPLFAVIVNGNDQIVDISSNAWTVTNIGAVPVVNDSGKRAVSISANKHLTVSSGIGATYSKVAAIKLTSTATNANIISSDATPNHTYWMPTNNTIVFGHGDNLNITNAQAVTLQLNTWYFLAMTYTAATNTIRHYVNGTLVQTITGVTSFAGQAAPAVQRIGAYTPGIEMTGLIALAIIYNSVLSAEQVSTLYDKYLNNDYTFS